MRHLSGVRRLDAAFTVLTPEKAQELRRGAQHPTKKKGVSLNCATGERRPARHS
jgi:hypothetical protein